MHTQRERTMWGHKKAARCKPRREASGKTKAVETWILDLWPPELWENKFLLLKLPNLWYFVMAALANTREFSSRAENLGVLLRRFPLMHLRILPASDLPPKCLINVSYDASDPSPDIQSLLLTMTAVLTISHMDTTIISGTNVPAFRITRSDTSLLSEWSFPNHKFQHFSLWHKSLQ